MHRPPSTTSALAALALTLALALPLGACVPIPTDGADPAAAGDPAAARQAIVGGGIDKDDPAVVLIYSSVPGTPGGFLCTGEVVSPHVVLTAAHCVATSEVGVGAVFRVFLGWDLNDHAQASDKALWVEGLEVHWDTKFDVKKLLGGHDIGVVITKTPIAIKPLPINRWPMTDNLRLQPARIVGYGLSDGMDYQGVTAGTKRHLVVGLTDFDSNLLYFNEANIGTCQGDSGGPALLDFFGTEVIAGVTSYGPRGCQSGGVDTRVDIYATWIDQWINQFDPGFTITDAGMPPPPDMVPVVRDMAMTTTPPDPGCSVAGGARATARQPLVALALLALVLARRARRRPR